MTAADAAAPVSVIAVTGLAAEARIAKGDGVMTLSGGGDAARLAVSLKESLARGVAAVISFGIAGGLAPGLTAGTVVVATDIDDGERRWTSDARWQARLIQALPKARSGIVAAGDHAVAGVAGKAALHRRSGALAVDMESHIAARLAAQHGVPFVALRVIADPAERTLPQAALVGMRPDGSTDVVAVLRALAAKPSDFPALIHTALDARAAFGSLGRSRRVLDALLGFGDGTIGTAKNARPGQLAPDALPAGTA